MNQYINIKDAFKKNFLRLLEKESKLKILLFDIFSYGTAYIVGGYFRDFLNGGHSRDIDIIVDIDPSLLVDIIDNHQIIYLQNRHGGIKLFFDNIEVDMWSIKNNWAFKYSLVELNEKDKLNSIAKGCFYNYDSLVINLHTFSYNIKNYMNFIKTRKLDILQKNPLYKNLNPTTEANIIRAVYIVKKSNAFYSNNTLLYLSEKIRALEDTNNLEKIWITLKKYPKYNDLTIQELQKLISQIKNTYKIDNQLKLEF